MHSKDKQSYKYKNNLKLIVTNSIPKMNFSDIFLKIKLQFDFELMMVDKQLNMLQFNMYYK